MAPQAQTQNEFENAYFRCSISKDAFESLVHMSSSGADRTERTARGFSEASPTHSEVQTFLLEPLNELGLTRVRARDRQIATSKIRR